MPLSSVRLPPTHPPLSSLIDYLVPFFLSPSLPLLKYLSFARMHSVLHRRSLRHYSFLTHTTTTSLAFYAVPARV